MLAIGLEPWILVRPKEKKEKEKKKGRYNRRRQTRETMCTYSLSAKL